MNNYQMQAIMSIVDKDDNWCPSPSDSNTLKRQKGEDQIVDTFDTESKAAIQDYITRSQSLQKRQKREIKELKSDLEQERDMIYERMDTLEDLYKARIEELEIELVETEHKMSEKDGEINAQQSKIKELEKEKKTSLKFGGNMERRGKKKTKERKSLQTKEKTKETARSHTEKYNSQKIKNLERLLEEKNRKIKTLFDKIDDLKVDNTALKEVLEEHVNLRNASSYN